MRATALWLIVLVALAAGCVKVDAKAPQGLYRTEPPPLSAIARANSDDRADLVRENQQLHDRQDWLIDQARRSEKKLASIDKDKQEVQADINRLLAEQEKYQKRMGQ